MQPADSVNSVACCSSPSNRSKRSQQRGTRRPRHSEKRKTVFIIRGTRAICRQESGAFGNAFSRHTFTFIRTSSLGYSEPGASVLIRGWLLVRDGSEARPVTHGDTEDNANLEIRNSGRRLDEARKHREVGPRKTRKTRKAGSFGRICVPSWLPPREAFPEPVLFTCASVGNPVSETRFRLRSQVRNMTSSRPNIRTASPSATPA